MKQWIKRALRIGSRINNSTSGSILHVDSNNKVAEDNSNFFWDAVNDRIGIGMNSPTARIHIKGSGNTNSTYPLKVDNSDSDWLFSIRDDGEVFVENNANIYGRTDIGGLAGTGYQTLQRFFRDGVIIGQVDNNASNLRFKAYGNDGGGNATNAIQFANFENIGFEMNEDDELETIGAMKIGDGMSRAIDIKPYTIHTGADTLTNSDNAIQYGDTDGGAFTLTLPASPTDGLIFTIKNTGGSANDLTIGRNGKTIDGDTIDSILSDNDSKTIQYTSDGWKII